MRRARQFDDVAHRTIPATAAGCRRRGQQRDRPAHRVARGRHRPEAEVLRQRDRVVGAILQPEVGERAQPAPVPAVVERNHAVAGRGQRAVLVVDQLRSAVAVQPCSSTRAAARRRPCRARRAHRGRGRGRPCPAAAGRAARAPSEGPGGEGEVACVQRSPAKRLRTVSARGAGRRSSRTAFRASNTRPSSRRGTSARISSSACCRAHRRPVGPLGGQCLIDVGDGQDPHRQRELAGREPVRVTTAVEPLVVGGRQRRERARGRACARGSTR